MAKITWYHFSDLHFREKDQFDRGIVLDSLWEDINSQIKNKQSLPDFILISGDIAFGGGKSEYERAEKDFLMPLMDMTTVKRQNIYFVPGNHDFDRTSLEYLNTETIKLLTDREKINYFLIDERKRSAYLHSFDHYCNFVGKFTQGSYFKASPAYGYNDTIDIRGEKISIVGINTAWSCNFWGSDNDKGKLLLGEHQILSAFNNVAKDNFTICLMHHPFDWFNESEKAHLQRLLMSKCRVLHHGHVHLATEISHSYASDHDCFIFGAAAAYDRRIGNDYYANGYTISTLDTNEGSLTLSLRKYVDSPKPHWTSNEDIIGEGSKGQHTFPLSTNTLTMRKMNQNNTVITNVDDIYRLCPELIPSIPLIRRKLESITTPMPYLELLINRYKESVCSYYSNNNSTFSDNFSVSVSISVLFGECVLKHLITERNAESINRYKDATVFAHRVLNECLPENLQEVNDGIYSTWDSLIGSWDAIPYQSTQENFEKFGYDPIIIYMILMILIIISDHSIASEVIGVAVQNNHADNYFSFIPSKYQVIMGSIVEIVIPAVNAQQFMATILIRHHIERRLDKFNEAFSSVNNFFPIQAIRIQILNHPNTWTEQNFTVDTPKIIEILMGSELYGNRSKDVWFRELLQNSIDACRSRVEVDRSEFEPLIAFSRSNSHLIISDNGIGMTRSHIDRYLCKVGRSIWRSEELTRQFENKTANLSIGKFGIGFLSVFEIASEITIQTRHFTEDNGHILKITSPNEPFFVSSSQTIQKGTVIELKFKDQYQFDLNKIANNFISYNPFDISIHGIQNINKTIDDALEMEISNSTKSKNIKWVKLNKEIPSINARISLAIPFIDRRNFSKDENPNISTSVNISNGGISILNSHSEWLGPEIKSGSTPTVGINGLHFFLDFQPGTAPVTVSRNGIKLSSEDAHNFLRIICDLVYDCWERYTISLFDSTDDLVHKTNHLMSMLNQSAKIDSHYAYAGYTRKWSDNPDIVNKAVFLLKKFGTVEVFFPGNDTAEKISIDRLSAHYNDIFIATKDQSSSSLFKFFWEKQDKSGLIITSDSRSEILLCSCNRYWKKISSDQDIWSVIDITEVCDWQLFGVIPAEAAIVPASYFSDVATACIILPRKRARADDVVGLYRNQVTDLPPRLLLNMDHIVWKTIEERLSLGRTNSEEIDNFFKMFFGLVVDEKSKLRRDKESRILAQKLMAILDMPKNTPFKITY
ncbi:metallophosphoesterase [Armatimonas sp.]|uniref:metallophosphoesterase n=1 Tax=Armatimonas sp. TaxID=1872638 RepID=UPI00374CB27B